MKTIDSGALTLLNRSLGLAGTGSQLTSLDDGLVNQVVDVAGIVRRSRTFGAGVFYAVFQNAHAAANTQISSVNVYAPGAVSVAPYPGTMPDGYDVWVLGAAGLVTAGGNFSTGLLSIQALERQVGIAVDESGSLIAGTRSTEQGLVRWDSAVTTGGISPLLTEAGEIFAPMGIRVPEGATMRFRSTSGGVGTFRAIVTLGVFPVGMGQDGVT